MRSNPALRYRTLPQFLLVLTFLTMLIVSWQRWTSLITDLGRETDLPVRLLNGEMLYRDVHYLYAPLSPYFNAFLYGVFGANLNTLIVSGVIFSILLAYLTYRICRKLMPPLESSIAVSFVIVLCVFKPNGNLILPYSFGALHAAVFSLVTVLFTLRYAENRKNLELVIAGIFIGLAGVTKQEFAFAGALTPTLYLIYLYRRNIAKLASGVAYTAIPAVIVACPVYALLFANIDWKILINDCHLFYTNLPESVIFYNRFRSGTNYPLASFVQMIGAAAVSVDFVSLLIFFSLRVWKLRRKLLLIIGISTLIAAIVLYFSVGQWDGTPLRALPFFLAGIIFIGWRRRNAATENDTSAEIDGTGGAIFIVAVYSLAVLTRVILRVPSGGFSGTFFLPASLSLIFYALLRELPFYVGKWTRDELSGIRAKYITRSFCIAAVVVTMISFGYRYRSKFVYEVSAVGGTVIVEKETGSVIAAAMKFIEANTAPNDVIEVVPEGNDLAFLTNRRINFRHQVLIPDFLSQQDELDAIEALKRGNVKYVFVTNRPMREFGVVAFGKDFYQTLGGFITENYRLVKVFGVPDGPEPEIGDPRYFIKAYERKEP
ncbi:MAG: glycosyltransferase family 39 protein [Pyrinomonadaceae bacterium]